MEKKKMSEMEQELYDYIAHTNNMDFLKLYNRVMKPKVRVKYEDVDWELTKWIFSKGGRYGN